MKEKTIKKTVITTIHIPVELHRRITDEAERQRRSRASLMIITLEDSLKKMEEKENGEY